MILLFHRQWCYSSNTDKKGTVLFLYEGKVLTEEPAFDHTFLRCGTKKRSTGEFANL